MNDELKELVRIYGLKAVTKELHAIIVAASHSAELRDKKEADPLWDAASAMEIVLPYIHRAAELQLN